MLSPIQKARTAILVFGLCGVLGFVAPALAQNTSGDMNRQAPAGPNAPKAPSTKPGATSQDINNTAGAIGSESRGSRTTPQFNEEGKPTTGH